VSSDTSKLTYKINHKKIKLLKALAFSYGGKAIYLRLTTSQINFTCKALKRGLRNQEKNEHLLSLTVAPVLSKNGSSTWWITHFQSGHRAFDGGGSVKFLKKLNNFVQFQFNVQKTISIIKTTSYFLKGRIRAKNCGIFQMYKGAKNDLQKKLHISVAGQKIEIKGATIARSFGKPQLRLSTGAHLCNTGTSGSDYVFNFSIEKNPQRISRLHVEGERVKIGYNIDFRSKKPEVSKLSFQSNSNKFFGTGRIEIKLNGKFKMGGLLVVIKGKIRAQRCRR
jgi:hypothetical protein